MTDILAVREASKRFLKHQVFSKVSFALSSGSFTVLLGANGTGKSTLLRACAGLTRLDSGDVRYDSLEPGKVPYRKLAFLGHSLFLYAQLTADENLRLTAKLLGVEPVFDYEKWGLTAHREKRVHELSKGLQARVALMRVMLCSPRFIILDEPTSSLDSEGVNTLVDSIKTARTAGGAVLVATHDVARVTPHADRIIVLKDGKISADSGSGNDADKTVKALSFYSETNR